MNHEQLVLLQLQMQMMAADCVEVACWVTPSSAEQHCHLSLLLNLQSLFAVSSFVDQLARHSSLMSL